MSLPLDLASDILVRLPPKSIAKHRCVSKLWSSITTDPYFTNSFQTRSLARPCLLMLFKNKDKLFVFSFPLNSDEPQSSSSSSQHHVEIYQLKYFKGCIISYKSSVHGLICSQNDTTPIIWNPSIKKLLTLPKPNKKWKNITSFLGYDPIEGKHKVMCMASGKASDNEYCRVLTLGSAKKNWRTIKTNQKHCPFSDSFGRCINGSIYYEAFVDDNSDVSGIIMRFDVRTEKFFMIKLPSDDFWGKLIDYKGKLACVFNTRIDITLWVLEDAEKREWSRKQFITPFARSLSVIYRIDGVNDDGEFICVPYTFLSSYFILYFDPVRNSLRRVEFKGIADDKFRFCNGLGHKRLKCFYFFSNHIDTLMSL